MDDSYIFYVIIGCALVVFAIHYYYKQQISKLHAQSKDDAQRQFESWREREMARVMTDQQAIARREAVTQLDQWKITHEATIRADAIMRSQAVITGKVTENIVPYLPVFPYNPKDVRFVGSPVDLIVFDGAAEGCVRDVIFLEVKTGNSSLNPAQRQIRDAVSAGRVQWRELRVNQK